MLTTDDRQLLSQKEITEDQLKKQLACFLKGFPFLDIKASASVTKGIKTVTEQEKTAYINNWENYLTQDKTVVKFVPASGAASRMFKDLFAFLVAPYELPSTDFEQNFFNGIEQFAFYKALDGVCMANEGKGVRDLLSEKKYKTIVSNLLEKDGLRYGTLPKGLLLFHTYPEGARTAAEEHLVEGALHARNKTGDVHIHLTVSPEHQPLFEELIEAKKTFYEQRFGVKYHLSFSNQQSHTDTIAADKDNQPFRDADGSLVFRPGGHGALIGNLNNLDADVVFIKNVDNVVPDHFKEPTVLYKKVIGGVLVHLQKQIFDYLELIDSGEYTHEQVEEMIRFLQNDLCIKNPETKLLEDVELILYIKRKLMRPLRVCGMVRNVGEPGGGPFFAVNPDGTVSLQILESSQIDMDDPEKKAFFEQGTHFNPVDLVCAVKDKDGNKYNLSDYVDKNTGFISQKSKDGRELQALELPGLWNGAMSDWNTVFVEVPIETFNPVKTVNDLLRSQHQ